MFQYLHQRYSICLGFLFAFLVNSIGPQPIYAQDLILPAPGTMVHLSPVFNPPILKGIKVNPENPFRFEFILDKGDSNLPKQSLKDESSKLVKYFLVSLTIPEKDLWVNLSPYEKDRVVPDAFGKTEMGRDLLAQDYMLKQITASLIYPEGEIGKKFWKRIYEEAAKKFGTTNVPVNTFNKVWIVPEKAVVYENAKAGTAYVVESRLKVMLEQDYLAESKLSARGGSASGGKVMLEQDYLSLEKDGGIQSGQAQAKDTNQLGSQIVREVVIPQLTKEINAGSNFTKLRQVYNSLILATWYKKKIKDSILSQVYANKNKVAGVSINDPQEKQRIYERYLQAFKKGAYNYIKEETDPVTQQPVPRKYFSGGFSFLVLKDDAMVTVKRVDPSTFDKEKKLEVISGDFSPFKDRAMTTRSENARLLRTIKERQKAVLDISRSKKITPLEAYLELLNPDDAVQIGNVINEVVKTHQEFFLELGGGDGRNTAELARHNVGAYILGTDSYDIHSDDEEYQDTAIDFSKKELLSQRMMGKDNAKYNLLRAYADIILYFPDRSIDALVLVRTVPDLWDDLIVVFRNFDIGNKFKKGVQIPIVMSSASSNYGARIRGIMSIKRMSKEPIFRGVDLNYYSEYMGGGDFLMGSLKQDAARRVETPADNVAMTGGKETKDGVMTAPIDVRRTGEAEREFSDILKEIIQRIPNRKIASLLRHPLTDAQWELVRENFINAIRSRRSDMVNDNVETVFRLYMNSELNAFDFPKIVFLIQTMHATALNRNFNRFRPSLLPGLRMPMQAFFKGTSLFNYALFLDVMEESGLNGNTLEERPELKSLLDQYGINPLINLQLLFRVTLESATWNNRVLKPLATIDLDDVRINILERFVTERIVIEKALPYVLPKFTASGITVTKVIGIGPGGITMLAEKSKAGEGDLPLPFEKDSRFEALQASGQNFIVKIHIYDRKGNAEEYQRKLKRYSRMEKNGISFIKMLDPILISHEIVPKITFYYLIGVSEFVQGATLMAQINEILYGSLGRGRLAEAYVQEMERQLQLGLFNWDVNFLNYMVDPHGRVNLVDFKSIDYYEASYEVQMKKTVIRSLLQILIGHLFFHEEPDWKLVRENAESDFKRNKDMEAVLNLLEESYSDYMMGLLAFLKKWDVVARPKIEALPDEAMRSESPRVYKPAERPLIKFIDQFKSQNPRVKKIPMTVKEIKETISPNVHRKRIRTLLKEVGLGSAREQGDIQGLLAYAKRSNGKKVSSTTRKIAKRFKVIPQTVSKIRKREGYRFIPKRDDREQGDIKGLLAFAKANDSKKVSFTTREIATQFDVVPKTVSDIRKQDGHQFIPKRGANERGDIQGLLVYARKNDGKEAPSTTKEIATQFGVIPQTVSQIRNRDGHRFIPKKDVPDGWNQNSRGKEGGAQLRLWADALEKMGITYIDETEPEIGARFGISRTSTLKILGSRFRTAGAKPEGASHLREWSEVNQGRLLNLKPSDLEDRFQVENTTVFRITKQYGIRLMGDKRVAMDVLDQWAAQHAGTRVFVWQEDIGNLVGLHPSNVNRVLRKYMVRTAGVIQDKTIHILKDAQAYRDKKVKISRKELEAMYEVSWDILDKYVKPLNITFSDPEGEEWVMSEEEAAEDSLASLKAFWVPEIPLTFETREAVAFSRKPTVRNIFQIVHLMKLLGKDIFFPDLMKELTLAPDEKIVTQYEILEGAGLIDSNQEHGITLNVTDNHFEAVRNILPDDLPKQDLTSRVIAFTAFRIRKSIQEINDAAMNTVPNKAGGTDGAMTTDDELERMLNVSDDDQARKAVVDFYDKISEYLNKVFHGGHQDPTHELLDEIKRVEGKAKRILMTKGYVLISYMPGRVQGKLIFPCYLGRLDGIKKVFVEHQWWNAIFIVRIAHAHHNLMAQYERMYPESAYPQHTAFIHYGENDYDKPVGEMLSVIRNTQEHQNNHYFDVPELSENKRRLAYQIQFQADSFLQIGLGKETDQEIRRRAVLASQIGRFLPAPWNTRDKTPHQEILSDIMIGIQNIILGERAIGAAFLLDSLNKFWGQPNDVQVIGAISKELEGSLDNPQSYDKWAKIFKEQFNEDLPRLNIEDILGNDMSKLMSSNAAMSTAERPGGIDLTSDKALTVQNNGQAIKLNLSTRGGSAFGGDPAQLAQWQNAPGVTFDIIDIRPMPDIRGWLGLNDQKPADKITWLSIKQYAQIKTPYFSQYSFNKDRYQKIIKATPRHVNPNLWIPKKESFFKIEDIPVLGIGKIDLKRVKAMAQKLVQSIKEDSNA